MIKEGHTIIENHLLTHIAGEKQQQLLMIIIGEGGTGKSLLISTIMDSV